MNNPQTEEQVSQNIPKILYVDDQLAQNIPRLFRLFEEYLGEEEQKRLQELEHDLEGYGADPEDIKQIFKNIQFIDIEYRFPDALAKILQHPEHYGLFIIDRNLADAEYSFEEVQKIDPQYSQESHKCFSEREGDYILVRLVRDNKITVPDKFYFLTAYSGQDAIRGIQDIKNRIDFVAFQHKNFIEKGNETDIQLLRDAIVSSPVHNPELYEQIQSSLVTGIYVFNLKDGSTFRGTFISPGLRIKTQNAKSSLNTSWIQKIAREGRHSNAEFKVELKTGDVYQGQILDRKLKIKTQIHPKYQIVSQNIQSVELE